MKASVGVNWTCVPLLICPSKDRGNHLVCLSWVRSSSAAVWAFPSTSITRAAGRRADRRCLSLLSDTTVHACAHKIASRAYTTARALHPCNHKVTGLNMHPDSFISMHMHVHTAKCSKLTNVSRRSRWIRLRVMTHSFHTDFKINSNKICDSCRLRHILENVMNS